MTREQENALVSAMNLGLEINCKTEEEAVELFDILRRHGIRWSTGVSLFVGHNGVEKWEVYGAETSYILRNNKLMYGQKTSEAKTLNEVMASERKVKSPSRAYIRRVRKRAIARKVQIILSKSSNSNKDFITKVDRGKLAKGKPFESGNRIRRACRRRYAGRRFTYRPDTRRRLDSACEKMKEVF